MSHGPSVESQWPMLKLAEHEHAVFQNSAPKFGWSPLACPISKGGCDFRFFTLSKIRSYSSCNRTKENKVLRVLCEMRA